MCLRTLVADYEGGTESNTVVVTVFNEADIPLGDLLGHICNEGNPLASSIF